MSARQGICWIIPSMNQGGTERQLGYLMEGLQEDYDLHLICTRRKGVFFEMAESLCTSAVCLRSTNAWDPRLGWQLSRNLKRCAPALMHSFLFGFDLAANRAARRAGVPVIVSSRRELPVWMKPRHLRIQRKANRYVDAIVANSRAVEEYAVQHEDANPDLFTVIPNGIDAARFQAQEKASSFRRFLGLPAEGPIIGMVANFSPVKDHVLFLEMAGHLLKLQPHTHFLLIGSGAGEKAVQAAIRAQGWEGKFTLTQAHDNIAEYYNVMDVAVLTSKVEGSPNVIAESMLCGVPTVAAAVGGIPELIRPDETGCLIQQRDGAAFAQQIHVLLQNPEKTKHMGEQARAWIRQARSVDKMVSAHKALYESLLQKKGATR